MPNQPQSPVTTGIKLAQTGSVFVFKLNFDPLSFRLRRTDVPNQVVELEKIWPADRLALIATCQNDFTRFMLAVGSLEEYLQSVYPAQKIRIRLIRAMNKDSMMSHKAVELLNGDINRRVIDPIGDALATIVKFDFELVPEEDSRKTNFWPYSDSQGVD